MKYVATHSRKVLGKAVHQTREERRKEREKAGRGYSYKGLEKPGKRGGEPQDKAEGIRKVEARYLVPKVEPFIETTEIRGIEERVKLWLRAGYPVHLIGPTGCGKTYLAMHIAKQLGRPAVWLNGDEAITTTELIGGYSQVETESLRDKYIHNVLKSRDVLRAGWVDNPLALACKHGYTLVYNEFSRTKPAANNVLLSILEEGILELPTKFGEERYVEVHPEFRAIMTSNSTEYAGVHRAQDALLDRMVGIFMDFYSFDTEVKIVRAHSGIPKAEAERIVNVVRELREKLKEEQKPGTRACIMAAQALKFLDGGKGHKLEEVLLDVVASKSRSRGELERKRLAIRESIQMMAGKFERGSGSFIHRK